MINSGERKIPSRIYSVLRHLKGDIGTEVEEKECTVTCLSSVGGFR